MLKLFAIESELLAIPFQLFDSLGLLSNLKIVF